MLVRLFFFNDPATTEISTLSLRDALPISALDDETIAVSAAAAGGATTKGVLTKGERYLVEVSGTYTYSKDRKSTRLNSSHANISYAVFCLKNNTTTDRTQRTSY